MFMIRRSDFFWKLLSWIQISFFLNGTLNFMQFSGVRRLWGFSLTFSDVNFVCHFPSSICAKGSEMFGPYSSSLLSSSTDFRMSPVLLAVGFSLEESSLTINADCFAWVIRSCASYPVSELTAGFVVFRFFGGSLSEDDELLLMLLLLLVEYLLFLF